MASVDAQALAPAQVLMGLRRGVIPSKAMPLGRLLERDFSGSPIVRKAVWEKATEMHRAFWDTWWKWRQAVPGASSGSFHDLVRLFTLEEKLAELMALLPTDFVLDLGCGVGWMAPFVLEVGGCSYMGLDSHEPTVVAAQERLRFLGLPGDIVEHDLLYGLPKVALDAITKAERARVLARWAFYLPMEAIIRIVRDAFEAGAVDITVDQLTAGKFSPPSLLAQFIPWLFWRLATRQVTAAQAWRAVKALRQMIPYGLQLKGLFPIWSVEQIADALSTLGCEVEELERPLWGQTTFLRVTRDSVP